MLWQPLPLGKKGAKRLRALAKEIEGMSDENIRSERIVTRFDDAGKRKTSLRTRLCLIYRSLKGSMHDVKYTVINHIKWHKTLTIIRPWEGFAGLFSVVQTHLTHYIAFEEKYGDSEEEYKENKINTAHETLLLLERMREPHRYALRRRAEVDIRFPDCGTLFTEYEDGGLSHGGCFVAQGKGWAGIESGVNPREGYFELIGGRCEPAESPDRQETDRLLDMIRQYEREVKNAYRQAELDSDENFEKLGRLLKDNLYTWWD